MDPVWPPLRELDDDARREVLRLGHRRTHGRNEVVFHAGDLGDTLHVVRSGRFAVRIGTRLGDTVTLNVLGSGDEFGELALLDPDARRSATVVSLERGETLVFHKRELDDLRRRLPAVDRFMVALLADRVRALSGLVVDALYAPVEVRVAKRLLEVAERFGGAVPGTVVTLTQQDLATMAGTTRPTANRVLREAEERGAIRLERGRIELVDVEALERMAR